MQECNQSLLHFFLDITYDILPDFVIRITVWSSPIGIVLIMNSIMHRKQFAMDNIISRLTCALTLSIIISVLLAQVISSLNGPFDHTAREPVAFISSAR